jgi:hypothetical protein
MNQQQKIDNFIKYVDVTQEKMKNLIKIIDAANKKKFEYLIETVQIKQKVKALTEEAAELRYSIDDQEQQNGNTQQQI